MFEPAPVDPKRRLEHSWKILLVARRAGASHRPARPKRDSHADAHSSGHARRCPRQSGRVRAGADRNGQDNRLRPPARLRAARPTGNRNPRGLVLVPTRELALQVHHDLVALEPSARDRIVSIYGGVGYGPQRQSLRRGAAVVVACPGRLEDLIERGDLRLSAVTTVVVDEADRMADMGFLPAVRRILGACAPDRQTMLFSATLEPAVSAIVKSYMVDPVFHEVAAPEETLGDVEHVFRSTGRAERTRSPPG